LWIFDKPLASLDKEGSKLIEQLITDHIQQGGLAIITTHQSLMLASVPVQKLELYDL
jgi:heme exporter protein A